MSCYCMFAISKWISHPKALLFLIQIFSLFSPNTHTHTLWLNINNQHSIYEYCTIMLPETLLFLRHWYEMCGVLFSSHQNDALSSAHQQPNCNVKCTILCNFHIADAQTTSVQLPSNWIVCMQRLINIHAPSFWGIQLNKKKQCLNAEKLFISLRVSFSHQANSFNAHTHFTYSYIGNVHFICANGKRKPPEASTGRTCILHTKLKHQNRSKLNVLERRSTAKDV